MNGAQKAIFPGILAGVFILIILTNLIAAPNAVLASTEEAPRRSMNTATPYR